MGETMRGKLICTVVCLGREREGGCMLVIVLMAFDVMKAKGKRESG